MPKKKKLTKKMLKFIKVYDGDLKKSAKKAGISYGYARNLMTMNDIVDRIKAREENEVIADNDNAIADRKERQAWWTALMRGEQTIVAIVEKKDETEVIKEVPDLKNRLKASECLGRSCADFVDKLHHLGLEKGVPQKITDEMDQKEATNIYLEMVREKVGHA